MQSDTISLVPFESCNASLILRWVESPEQLWNWAARDNFPLSDTGVFEQWHADLDVTPHEFRLKGELVGYGETWCESAERWAELGRLIIAPTRRNRGFGRLLVEHLVDRVRQLGFDNAWVRVFPTNQAAIACYRKALFVRVSEAREQELNTIQPHAYVWMQRNVVLRRSPASK